MNELGHEIVLNETSYTKEEVESLLEQNSQVTEKLQNFVDKHNLGEIGADLIDVVLNKLEELLNLT